MKSGEITFAVECVVMRTENSVVPSALMGCTGSLLLRRSEHTYKVKRTLHLLERLMFEKGGGGNLAVVDKVVQLVFGISLSNVGYAYAVCGVGSLLNGDTLTCWLFNVTYEYVGRVYSVCHGGESLAMEIEEFYLNFHCLFREGYEKDILKGLWSCL